MNIDGVKVKELKVIPDERGKLFEILRRDDEMFTGFGQAYITTCKPGVIKAWHHHKHQTDNFCPLNGKTQVGLYDAREDSPTCGTSMSLEVDPAAQPILIQIPPGVLHGMTPLEDSEVMLLNIPTNTYNYDSPDEFREPFDKFPDFEWKTPVGLTPVQG
ncbi:MAG: dTDP-4-dehydrorhamnose 3,5-epimerase [Planctomycetota bacterium]|nr:MAG: dTDP-4-dehydrorhamnose 3,5-epimerase [Planctomycetota bacterium]